MRLVHLSDPHLSHLRGHTLWSVHGKRRLGYLSWSRRRRHHHRRGILDQLVAAVAAQAPDRIAVTGDLVQLGLASEVQQARVWLERLGAIAPLALVPGNHDLYQPDSADAVFADWAPWLHTDRGRDDYPVQWALPGVALIGLNSARPERFWSAGGEIGPQQLERLEALLEKPYTAPRVVMLHHPPRRDVCPQRKALRDAEALAAVLVRGRVDVVLHGHVHRNLDYSLGPATRVFATASASNGDPRAPASFRVLDLDAGPEGTTVTGSLHVLDGAGGGFANAGTEAWVVSTGTAA